MRMFKHSLSNYRLSTLDMGNLVPVGHWEVLPTDRIQGSTSMMIRLSPMAAPVMHPITVRLHNWFVPYRLLWNALTDEDAGNWEDFITGGPDGMDASTPPKINTTGVKGDLIHHLGLPDVAGIPVNAFAVRAYNLIFNEFYRDQDLVPEVDLNSTGIQDIAWERDYFTTARPWTQKGPEILLPLGDKVPVEGIGINTQSVSTSRTMYETNGTAEKNFTGWGSVTNEVQMEEDENNPGFPKFVADLSAATGLSVNELRRSMAIQRFQEARAAYGSRYAEYLRHMGASPLDQRLQRPEFISGGRARVSISEVLQTAPETGNPPTTQYGVGDMYGHGISAMRTSTYRKTFNEHGIMMTLLSVRPRTIYQDGIDKHFLRNDKEEYFQRELQFIGQQDVKMNEIFADPTHTDQDILGYQDRYREYRETPSKVCGDFRDTLDFWHLGRQFDQAPALNASLVTCKPSKRIFNVQTEDTLWCAAQHRIVAKRQVAKNAVGRIL